MLDIIRVSHLKYGVRAAAKPMMRTGGSSHGRTLFSPEARSPTGAEVFVWASGAILLLMAVPLVLPNGRTRQALLLGGFVGTLVVFGLGYNAGEAGGRLVYEYGAAQVYVDLGGIPGGAVTDDGGGDSDSD